MSQVLSILKVIFVIIEVLLIFNLVIIVHELGHFLAARWRGAVVEEFGVWFGKPIWRKKIGTVWYSLGSIPAGGFVKLPQMAPMETIEGESDTPREEQPPLKPLDKIIVAVAGPLFSFLLALTLGCVTWAVGTPSSQPDKTTKIGTVLPGGPAELAGLKRGDEILSIDGHPVSRFTGQTDSVLWYVVSSQGDTIHFVVRRDGQEIGIDSGYTRDEVSRLRRKPPRMVKISPLIEPIVATVAKDSLGEKAGFKPDDLVLSANGEKIITLEQIGELLKTAYTAPMTMVVQRGLETLNFTLPPIPPEGGKAPENIPGLEWGKLFNNHPNPVSQVGDSMRAMRNMIGAALSRKGDIGADQFSGPVGIMNLYRRILVADEGWRLAIAFSVFFNVNLALVNMLPFPVLDGGHITLAIIEALRRRPVNARALEILQTGCALLLVGFILYVTYFDIGDMVPKHQSNEIPQIEQKPTVIESAEPRPHAAPATPAP